MVECAEPPCKTALHKCKSSRTPEPYHRRGVHLNWDTALRARLNEEGAMARKRRLQKTAAQRLNDCETHVFFLWDALRLYRDQRDRYKQAAAELRVLVCETHHNKPLLLDLMDKYGFKHEVQPPHRRSGGPPLKPQPVPMVGWREDPEQNAISDELADAMHSQDQTKMQDINRKLENLACPIPFREWVNKGLAVYIFPYDYSHRELTLAIAQQMGSSHEDESLEEPIVRLQHVVLAGETSEVATLIDFAHYVLSVGIDFLKHLVTRHGYQPKHFTITAA